MKKPNAAIEILKILAALLAGWLLWVCIFSALSPAEEMVEPFAGAAVLLGVLTGLAVSAGLQYNAVHKARQEARSAESGIRVYEERADRLLDKANRVAEKYMRFEAKVQVGIAQARGVKVQGRQSRFSNAAQFQSALEGYPDLKANESVMELLRQIKECENGLASQKLAYNAAVEGYNTRIHSFPVSLLRKGFRFEEMDFYTSEKEEDMISDEALGI